MEPEVNPYAPPTIDENCLAPVEEVVGIWRAGSNVIVHRDCAFPPICARTLEPADSLYRLQWGLFFLTTIQIPISRKWNGYRWRRFIAYLGLSIILPAMSFASLSVIDQEAMRAIVAIGGVCLAAFFFLLASDLFTPFSHAGTSGSYITISGFSKSYLEQLPAWPGTKKLQQQVEW